MQSISANLKNVDMCLQHYSFSVGRTYNITIRNRAMTYHNVFFFSFKYGIITKLIHFSDQAYFLPTFYVLVILDPFALQKLHRHLKKLHRSQVH